MVFEMFSEFLKSGISGFVTQDMNVTKEFTDGFLGGAFFGFFVLFVVILIAGFYVYHAIAWYTIARKLKYKRPWLSWIPFASSAMQLQMGKFHWGWVFLYLVPVFGWIAIFVLLIIAHWRIFEKRKYPGWFSLSVIIPKAGGVLYLIAIGLVAWKDRKRMMFE